jgi:transposase
MQEVYKNFIGIDIGKNEFVTATHGSNKTLTFTNAASGWNKFLSKHKKYLENCLIVLESTGGYENDLLLFLVKKSISVHRADTRKIKNFIRSFGKYAKTDAIDALALAKYAFERNDRLQLFIAPSEDQSECKLLVERRQDLTKMMVQEKNRAQAPLNKSLKPDITKHIRFLEKQIQTINDKLKKIIEADKTLKEKKEVISVIPGLGDVTSTTLLAYMPELGQLNRKEIASLAGLAPHPRESGTKSWRRTTIGGRRSLRPILFMSSMSASRSHTRLGSFYKSLIDRKKKPIVAQVALMRKIIVIANAKIRDYLAEEQAKRMV